MKTPPVKLTPLTIEEQTFSEDHYSIFEKCIKRMYLDDDQQGVAALGYLHAVKKWIARPDLHQYSFSTICTWTIRSHLVSQQRKDDRRIKEISLDAVIPGTEDLCYGDQITYKHMSYLYGMKEEQVSVKFNYDVKIPEVARHGGSKSVEIEKLLEFLDSKYKTMSFEYVENKQAINKASSLRIWKKSHNRTDFNIYKVAETIYIEKIPKSKKGGSTT